MKLEFNPRNFLRLVLVPLLQSYFAQRDLLTDFDWDDGEEDIEPLYARWMALPPGVKQAIWVDFENASGLCSRRGIQTLIDSAGPDRDRVLNCMGKGNTADKVFRVLLDHPEVFLIASQFAWADGLKRHWHPRQDIPAAEPKLDGKTVARLKKSVVARYQELDGRGEYSEIEVHWRGEVVYVMIYLSDHPEAVIHFEDSNQLKRSTQQRAFDVVYKFEPATGAFEMYAEGDKEFRRSLAQDFVTGVLKKDVILPLEESFAFDLAKLKDPNFRFATDGSDGVRSMDLLSMRLDAPGVDGGRITFGPRPRSQKTQLHRFIKRGLNQTHLPLSTLIVDHVTINARVANGNKRPASVTFNISATNACNLKDTTEHNKIRTCLKRSGVILGQSSGAAVS